MEANSMELRLLCGVLDALPGAVALLNRAGEVAYCNPQGETLSLYDLPVSDLDVVKQCLEGVATPHMTTFLPQPDSETVQGILSVYPVRQDEELLGGLFIFMPSEVADIAGQVSEFPYVSEIMAQLFTKIDRLGYVNTSALFLGERGTERCSLAKALHQKSPRAALPFVVLYCDDNEEQMNSRLYGSDDAPGLLQEAAEGTLYLEDIHLLPLPVQNRLLECWRLKQYTRPDGSVMPWTTRLMASAIPDLPIMVQKDQFSADLYGRIGLITLTVPPLRERHEDIEPLAAHFLSKYAAEMGKSIHSFSEDARKVMLIYGWPGNLQELDQMVKTAVISCEGGVIAERDLPFSGLPTDTLHRMRSGFERERILSLLNVYGHSVEGKRRAAAELGIGLSTLYRLLKG